jgi:hypothetical protein
MQEMFFRLKLEPNEFRNSKYKFYPIEQMFLTQMQEEVT